MTITFDELRSIKHRLPTGSVSRIAKTLKISEQTVRNYFGAAKYTEGDIPGYAYEPGPGGGIVSLEDTAILDLAKSILAEEEASQPQQLLS